MADMASLASRSLNHEMTRTLTARAGPSSSPANNSVTSMVTTLVPTLAIALAWVALFLLLRPRFKRFYQARSFLTTLRPEARSPTLPQGAANWFSDFYKLPDTYVLNHNSLDGYLLLRYIKISSVTCFVGCLITWPVLFPVNATGKGGAEGLDILSMTNIQDAWRLFAHAGCACIFFSFVIYMITRESIFYISLRQAYLMSPLYASRISSRTVLFTSVPEEYMEEGKLRWMLGEGVRRVWFAQDAEKLEEKVEERDKTAMKLEGAETKLIRTANAARIKAVKKNKGSAVQDEGAAEQGSVAAQYLKPKDRPTHRLKFLIGKKVDTIDWCRSELKRLIPEVDALQASHRGQDGKKLSSVFVEFDTVALAQSSFQSLTHHQALHMSPRYAGVNPTEVIWSNLNIKWWELVLRKFAATTFVVLLILFWAIPVAGVGAISNVNYLMSLSAFSWLSFINKLPTVLLGLITGLLPVVALAVLMALLPIILRAMAKFAGAPTRGQVELTTQNSYFAFQIVQVFLVTTLGSAASSVASSVAQDPSSAPTLLAKMIPKAANIFLCWFLLQGLAVASSMIISIVGLALFLVLGKILDSTPRKMYKRWITLSGMGWGTIFPIISNLWCIALCYAAIAPLVLGFAAIGLYLFYIAYRYNLMFVSGPDIDTKGRVFPRALSHIFVGLYVAELCLVGLFAIRTGSSVGAIGPLIMMILMLVGTALYHVSLNSALAPLINYLPKTLDAEERAILEAENGGNVHGEKNGHTDKTGHVDGAVAVTDSSAPPHKKPNFFSKWLRPDIYCDYKTMRRLVPKDIAISYSPEDEQNAFFHPAIASPTPLLWIPRDPMGLSRQEVQDTSSVIPITDEAATLDEKNKIVWDAEDGRPPIYEEKPYY